MNNRNLLLVLICFVCLTTAMMFLMTKKFPTLRLSASSLFFSEGGDGNVTYGTRQLVTDLSRPPKAANESTPHTNQTSNGTGTAAEKTTPSTTKRPTSPTNRPMLCQGCFFSDFPSLIENPSICWQVPGSTKPEMIMMITSSLDGFERRQAIRDTWASVCKNNTAHVRYVFLLGTTSDRKVSDEVRSESSRYGDMLVSDFVDSYRNLTFKTLVGLHWIIRHCGHIKFFMKTDQDMYVFVDRILSLSRAHESTLKKSLGGSCHQSAKPWRDPKTKYYASVRSYPQSTYPGFCSGTGYVSTLDVARKIVETSPNIPFFHLEDVYLALLLRHVHYKLVPYQGFAQGSGVCKNFPSRARSAMTIHEVKPQEMRQMWASKCGL